MGYYLDIVFPPKTENGNKILELAFEDAGFQQVEENRWYLPSGAVDVYSRESDKIPGEWASIRLSWETRPKNFSNLLVILIRLGEKYGFRTYDGQIKKYVEKENFSEAVRMLRYGYAMVSSMFGTVRKNKTEPNFPGDPDFLGPFKYCDPVLGRFPLLGGPLPVNSDELRGRLADTVAFYALDFDSVIELKIPQQVKAFLVHIGVDTVEKLLMKTPLEIEQIGLADGQIKILQRAMRDMMGLWEFDDFSEQEIE